MIFDLLQDLNQECSFTDSIKESTYIEKINKNNNSSNQKGYRNSILCILSKCDHLYDHIPENEKDLYMKQKISKICSEIDEKSKTHFDNFKFNEKLMKSSKIQLGLQLSEKNQTMISSIYYLTELFKKHFVFVKNNKLFRTCIKDYPKVFIVLNGNQFYYLEDEKSIWKYSNPEDLFNELPIINDINKSYKLVYKMPLEPITKYKIDELKQLAINYKIPLKDGIKNKVKQVLYDEINLFLINQ